MISDGNQMLPIARRHALISLLFIALLLNLSPIANGKVGGSFLPEAQSLPLPAIGYSPQIVPVTGKIRVLVIAVTFADLKNTLSIAQMKQGWFHFVAEYYREISYGKLTVQGDAYGWYKLPYPEAHYGRDCKSIDDSDCSGSDQSWQIAKDAVTLAAKDVNFNNYDYFVFLHAGRGQETSHTNNDIWSVTYVSNVTIQTNSKPITRFNIVPELEEPPYVPNGVWCVEFAHNLGIPDLYNTSKGPNGGQSILGPWELMDKGSWNGDPPGSLPAQMTSWAKIKLGFISGPMLTIAYPKTNYSIMVDPTEINSTNVHAIKITPNRLPNASQYYLVEVREQTGFDSALPTAGVLITYVNETTDIGKVRIMNSDPGVADLEDAAWRVGQTFVDSKNHVTVDIASKVANAYKIIISNDGSPIPVAPSPQPPLVSLSITGHSQTSASVIAREKSIPNQLNASWQNSPRPVDDGYGDHLALRGWEIVGASREAS